MGQIQSAMTSGVNTVLAAYMGSKVIDENNYNKATKQIEDIESAAKESLNEQKIFDTETRGEVIKQTLDELPPENLGYFKYNKRYNKMLEEIKQKRISYWDGGTRKAVNQKAAETIKQIKTQNDDLNNVIDDLSAFIGGTTV